MVARGTGWLLFLANVECESNHSNALIINGAGSESIDDLGGILDLFDLGIGTNVSTLNKLFAILAVECHLKDVEVAVVETNAGHLLVLFEFKSLGSWLVLLAPLSGRGPIGEVEFDGLKCWLLEFIGDSWPLYFLQV